MKNILLTSLIMAGSLVSSGALAAEKSQSAMPAEMQQMMKSYKPELRQKVMALSPELKVTIQQLHAGHTRHAKETTMRQIMHEILSEYQNIASALATDNAEQASEAAHRLANHRIPKGGLLAYFPLDKVNNNDLAILPSMNDIVEGSAIKLANAADAGDMPKAASYMSDIMTGCVACHQKFRGAMPGTSGTLLPAKAK